MKDVYWEYYHPEKAELKQLKKDAVFSFDSSSLLELYCLPKEKVDSVIAILEELAAVNRVWLPHQFGEEYYRHRKQKIQEQFEYYAKAVKSLEDFAGTIKGKVMPEFKVHYGINKEEIHSRVTALVTEIKNEVAEKKEKHPDLRKKDPICEVLEKIFSGHVGEEYKDDQYAAKIAEVETRIRQKKQPGLSDSKGLGGDKINGDALAWIQILDHMSADKRPIILITEETKADFWEEKRTSHIILPRRSLVREVYDKTGQLFFILNLSDFIRFVKELDYLPSYPDTDDEEVLEVQVAEVIGVDSAPQLTDKKD